MIFAGIFENIAVSFENYVKLFGIHFVIILFTNLLDTNSNSSARGQSKTDLLAELIINSVIATKFDNFCVTPWFFPYSLVSVTLSTTPEQFYVVSRHRENGKIKIKIPKDKNRKSLYEIRLCCDNC